MSGRWRGRVAAALVAVAVTTAGCKGRGGNDVVVYTSVDQVFSEPVFRHCEHETGLRVRAVFDTEETKSTGVLNRLVAEGKRPQADVFWSGDPVRPFILARRGLLEPYRSGNAEGIPAGFRAIDGTWTGFAARARVLLVNTKLVAEADRPVSVRDLADPRWRGKTAIANPLFGTTTMHIAALFSVWGEAEAGAFLAALKANEVRIAASNGEVKRLVVAGEIAFGLTDTDDAHQAVEAGESVAVVYPDQGSGGALVMPTTVVLIKNGPHSASGRRLIDCLLTAEVEGLMATAAAHMPLRAGVPTPANVRGVDSIEAMAVDYGRVAEMMEEIQPRLREWTGL